MKSYAIAASVAASLSASPSPVPLIHLTGPCMQGPLVDVVSLALLVTFFGIQQRNRPQVYFRFWSAGWILVFLSFLIGDLRLANPLAQVVCELVRLNAIFFGGFAFVLSFIAQTHGPARTTRVALLLGIPGSALISLATLTSAPAWLLFGLVLVCQIAAIHLTFTLVPRHWRRRRVALLATSLLFALAMFPMVEDAEHSALLASLILAQVFFCAAILYSGSTRRGSVEWFAGTLGFSLWALSSFVTNRPRHEGVVLLMIWQLWNLPKYIVGFAMMLRIFEGGRHDVVRMADRYKVLYEDFRLLYENHPLPMWIYDASTRGFLSVNAAACENYGYTREEFLAMSVDEICGDTLGPQPETGAQPQLPAAIEPAPDAAAPPPSQDAPVLARHRRRNGTLLAAELTEHEILFQGSEARFVLALDITEREKLNLELIRQARHDALTGLPNRFLLDDRIDQCLLRSTRENRKAVLFTIDADRFKLINDTYGHLVGDEALKAIADRLRSRIRSVDTIARTGGEEFTAIIGGLAQSEDAEKIASMFVRLFDVPLTLPGGQELKVSVSVGGAIFPDDAEDAPTLRRKSDQAVYHAKRLGRNRFAFASEEVCASFDQATAVELAIRNALRTDGFQLLFQPIFDEFGRAVRFEALLRMSPANPEIYPPSVFIPVAEESGLIVQLGGWVVEEVCRHLVHWRDVLGERCTVAINVSGRQILQKDFAEHVHETLRAHGLPTEAIQLELTESSLMTEPALMRDAMAELAETGIQFAIDDFGTGYSSLARLADLPISQLKIDRSFIAQLDRTTRADGIVSAIIHMAQTLKVQVVAEGVEDESQLNGLLRKGCDLFQGFYLAHPLSALEITSALHTGSTQLLNHPLFSNTRIAVSKRVRSAGHFPALAGAVIPGVEEGAA